MSELAVNDISKITVNTGLSGFLLIDRIIEAGFENISGVKNFVDTPTYLGVESLAQLGAYHVRFLTRFERHAFLLKITLCKISAGDIIDGQYLLYGALENRSDAAFAYKVKAKKGDETHIEGDFLYGTVNYSTFFKKEILQNHYREAFSCLKNDIKTD